MAYRLPVKTSPAKSKPFDPNEFVRAMTADLAANTDWSTRIKTAISRGQAVQSAIAKVRATKTPTNDLRKGGLKLRYSNAQAADLLMNVARRKK